MVCYSSTNEFDRKTLEVLREPLETGQIHISRAARQATFPARFQLVAAMNPCPGSCASIQSCDCSNEQLNRYRNKLSAPLLDRIDIRIELARLSEQELLQQSTHQQENSETVKTRVMSARQIQTDRQGQLNASLNNQQIEMYCQPDDQGKQLLSQAIERLKLSVRSYHRILKLARTIADLAQQSSIHSSHISEAIQLRRTRVGNQTQ